jgi:hypothetical protein
LRTSLVLPVRQKLRSSAMLLLSKLHSVTFAPWIEVLGCSKLRVRL